MHWHVPNAVLTRLGGLQVTLPCTQGFKSGAWDTRINLHLFFATGRDLLHAKGCSKGMPRGSATMATLRQRCASRVATGESARLRATPDLRDNQRERLHVLVVERSELRDHLLVVLCCHAPGVPIRRRVFPVPADWPLAIPTRTRRPRHSFTCVEPPAGHHINLMTRRVEQPTRTCTAAGNNSASLWHAIVHSM